MAVLISLATGCHSGSGFLPDSLGSLDLVEEYSSEDARTVIDRIHSKKVAPEENFVGRYASGLGQATLYVSLYGREEEAEKSSSTMANRLRRSKDVFTRYDEVEVRGRTISTCVGLGQIHYFFSHKKFIYWLSADARLAKEAIEDLVGKVGL